MATFHTQRFVEFHDTDMAGITHFTAFFRWMESAEHAFLRSLGLSVLMTWEGQQIAMPRVSASCDFRHPVRCEDTLDVSVNVAKLGRSSMTYKIAFTHQGQPVAEGQITSVFCRKNEAGRLESMELPAAVRAKLEEYQA